MSSKKIKIIVTAAFFIALDIIVARFLTFEYITLAGPMKFDFQIIVAAICGYTLGPLWAMLTLISSDILGAMLNGGSLGMFFGFTLSAALRGLLFGILLNIKSKSSNNNKKNDISIISIIYSVPIVYITVDIFLNTLWLSIMMSTPYVPLLVTRLFPKLTFMVVTTIIAVVLKKLFVISKKQISN